MAFQYRLESLLRLQRGLEHQEENRLLARVAAITALRTRLREWEQARLNRKAAICAGGEVSVSAAVLHLAMEWDRAAAEQQSALSKQLAAAERARLQQLQVYREARQKREVLESLREQQQSEYLVDELRQIQQNLDEAFLIHKFHTENG